ncbi:hypothetical protein RUM43_008658 [Polyplax serrata]|uniref:Uncharacterized protein n=1 Tax=Polyplax serrata TaxID=468196 RepID=A0AAN8NU03_POLSC
MRGPLGPVGALRTDCTHTHSSLLIGISLVYDEGKKEEEEEEEEEEPEYFKREKIFYFFTPGEEAEAEDEDEEEQEFPFSFYGRKNVSFDLSESEISKRRVEMCNYGKDHGGCGQSTDREDDVSSPSRLVTSKNRFT